MIEIEKNKGGEGRSAQSGLSSEDSETKINIFAFLQIFKRVHPLRIQIVAVSN